MRSWASARDYRYLGLWVGVAQQVRGRVSSTSSDTPTGLRVKRAVFLGMITSPATRGSYG
jgi:hypothetical protein